MKVNGEVHLVDRESDRVVSLGTCQCCHCGRHWEMRKGSGKLRGYCLNCKQVTCGNRLCDPCVHWRQKQDNLEGGLAVNHRPVIVQGLDVRELSTR